MHGLSHHKVPQGARVEARPTLVRGVNGKKVWRQEGNKHTGCVRGANALKGGRTVEPRGEGGNEEVPLPGGSGGAHVDGDDDTAGHCVRRAR